MDNNYQTQLFFVHWIVQEAIIRQIKHIRHSYTISITPFHITHVYTAGVKEKVKQSHYRPGVAQRVPGS